MKFNYGGQSVDITMEWRGKIVDKVMISVSGGLDSAALLYLMCKHFPEVKKHVYTGKDPVCPFDAEAAIDVVQWCKDNIDNHNIATHDVIVYDDRDPKVHALMQERVDANPKLYDQYPWEDKETVEESRFMFLQRIAKPWLIEQHRKELREKYGTPFTMAAMTQNPPVEDMERLGFLHRAETKRNPGRDDVPIRGHVSYHPFARVNKKFVASVFEEEGLMDEYYHLTGSCTGVGQQTEWFSKPCEDCFWCYEKHWAFGRY